MKLLRSGSGHLVPGTSEMLGDITIVYSEAGGQENTLERSPVPSSLALARQGNANHKITQYFKSKSKLVSCPSPSSVLLFGSLFSRHDYFSLYLIILEVKKPLSHNSLLHIHPPHSCQRDF